MNHPKDPFSRLFIVSKMVLFQIEYKHDVQYEPRHEIFKNMLCATSKASDQPAHTLSLIRAFASRFSIL